MDAQVPTYSKEGQDSAYRPPSVSRVPNYRLKMLVEFADGEVWDTKGQLYIY